VNAEVGQTRAYREPSVCGRPSVPMRVLSVDPFDGKVRAQPVGIPATVQPSITYERDDFERLYPA
jgi:hypothetical protein